MKVFTIAGSVICLALCALAINMSSCSSSSDADSVTVAAASDISYNNKTSDLTAKNVQDAIDELVSPNCPSGMAKVTTHGRVCVDQTVNISGTTKTFAEANTACVDASKRLCYAYELIAACLSDVITDAASPGAEWTASIISGTAAVNALDGNCTTTASTVFSGVLELAYRCCKDI